MLPVPCPTGTACHKGACQPVVCLPGSQTCQNGAAAVCDAEGFGWTLTKCTAGHVCAAGQCKPVVCGPAGKSCLGNKVMACNADGTEQVAVDCGAQDQGCLAGTCVKQPCAPGSVACVGTQVGKCLPSGVGYVLLPCDDGDPCTVDTCDAATGTCAIGKVTTCADGNPCTEDVCLPFAAGCGHTPKFGPCNDGSACTSGDLCVNGACKADPYFALSHFGGKSSGGYLEGPVATANLGAIKDMGRAVDGGWILAETSSILKLAPNGMVSVMFSSWGPGVGSGKLVATNLADLLSVVQADDGAIYVGTRDAILRIGPGGNVTTVAGTWQAKVHEGTGTNAIVGHVTDMVLAANGDLITADPWNARIRRVTPSGVVSVLAGGKVGAQDGPALQATFKSPSAFSFDPAGNLYIADGKRLRKLDPAGLVSTVIDLSESFIPAPAYTSFYHLAWTPFGLVTNVNTLPGLQLVQLDANIGVMTQPGSLPLGEGLHAIAHTSGNQVMVASSYQLYLLTANFTVCDDKNPCTVDLCLPANGVCQFQPLPAGSACEDGNACTKNETCDAKAVCKAPAGAPCPP